MLFYTKPGGANTNALSERMRILDSGSIGIGTSTPGNTLEVNGGITSGGLLVKSGGNPQVTLSNPYAETDFGLAFTAGNYSAVANPGDLVIRNTLAGGKLIMQNGSLGCALAVGGNNYVGFGGNCNAAYPVDVSGAMQVSGGIIVSKTSVNLQLNDNTGYQIMGAAHSSLFDASSIQTTGRSNAAGGNLLLQCLDNASTGFAFSKATAGGVVSPMMQINTAGQVLIGTSTPPSAGYLLDVASSAIVTGNIVSQSNVISKAGVVGPTLNLGGGSFTMATGSNTVPTMRGLLEDGNPGLGGGSAWNGGFFNGTDNTGLGLSWNKAYLTIRGCMVGTGVSPTTATAIVKSYNSNAGAWTSLTAPFSMTDAGSSLGYTTNTSPIFGLSNTNGAALGFQITNPQSGSYQVGSVNITFLN
jgi:hypothetical protein